MEAKKAFTLVELLVAMAIIAVLLGLAVFGITIVQQNARDTQRRSMVNDIEIALNGLIASNQALPNPSPTSTTTTVTIGTTVVQLTGSLVRQGTDSGTAAESDASVSDYCYGNTSGTSLYVVGVELEGGGFYFKSNSGATYATAAGAAFPGAPTGTGPTCADGNL